MLLGTISGTFMRFCDIIKKPFFAVAPSKSTYFDVQKMDTFHFWKVSEKSEKP